MAYEIQVYDWWGIDNGWIELNIKIEVYKFVFNYLWIFVNLEFIALNCNLKSSRVDYGLKKVLVVVINPTIFGFF